MSSNDRTKRQKIDGEAPPMILTSEQVTAAVTVLTVLPGRGDATVFSGHRDGTIGRWDIAEDTASSTATWVISACPNLTQHELYGNEEKLGVAGLVVRALQQDSRNGSDDSHVLYSWNHQREDMRDSNGIPQKVMIWNCRNGERCSALMVDVGRCDTGLFANPLVSCLVFCQLLVDPPPLPPAQLAGEESTEPAKKKAVDKVWIDAIVVGLQATCDEPAAVVAGTHPPPKGPSGSPPGNIVPFDERTRRRMPPWSAPGGFVRALVVLTENCVVSITETVAPRKKAEESTADDAAVDHVSNPRTEEVDSVGGGGESHEITVWDCSCPGTVLSVVLLRDIVSMTRESIFQGAFVSAVSVWSDQVFLVISFSTSSVKDASSKAVVLKVKRNAQLGCTLLVVGVSNPFSDICAASSHASNWIALVEKSKVHCPTVKVYDFQDVANVIGDKSSDNFFDLRKMERAFISSASFTKGSQFREPLVVSIGSSHVLVGYSNGSIVLKEMAMTHSCSNVSNESVSCSNAPVGLRGVLCPHLSSDANNVHLQNQCVVV
jgi:hypothetical protein